MESTTLNFPANSAGQPDLHSFIKAGKTMNLRSRIRAFADFIEALKQGPGFTYCRLVTSPSDREVIIWDADAGKERRMLMFASNNYLGLANHPYVRQKVGEAIRKYGVGLGGPPLLNGFTRLMQELEERLAHFKHQEAALVFPSGYMANLGMVNALVGPNDHILYDELSHASLHDAIHLSGVASSGFRHNNLSEMEAKLEQLTAANRGTVFVGIEGVYSMDGDLAPLHKMVPIAQKYGALTMLDDAHGSGVLGKSGSGTAEHFGVERQIDLSMGTFSKTFAVTGGFVAASRDMVNYMRFFARPYMFSAALPPTALAAVLAGIDVIENEPWLRERLLENARYAIEKLRPFGLTTQPEAAILALQVPEWMDLRKANYHIHKQGIFLNAIEYPAVPEGKERFRISLMAAHTRADIDRLAALIAEIWQSPAFRKPGF
jgi:glycine C-acetyltransferase